MAEVECYHCGHIGEPEFILTPEIVHYGKDVCAECGRFMKWVKDPNATYSNLMTEMDSDDPVLQFGKHRGIHISAVPDEYLKWMYEADFPEAIIQIVEEELIKRGVDV